MVFNSKFFPQHLLKSELLRNASILISGSVIAQLISIILRTVLTRIYSAEQFGIYSAYLSLIGILLVVSSLRYDDAIVLPKSDKESLNLLGLSLFINLLFNTAIFFLVIITGKNIITFLNLPENFPVSMLYLIPVGAFLFSTYQSLNSWLIRKKKYYSVSVNKLARRSSEGVAQLSFGISKAFNGLIFSDIIGQAANVATVTYQAKRIGLNLGQVSLTKLKYVFHRYSEFPRHNLIPAFMSSCSFLLPPLFINKFYSSESAGFFDISKLLLSIPLAFVATSISSVLLQKLSEKFNKSESFLDELKPIFITVGLISFVEIISILLFGEEIFRICFGKQYVTSGAISKILVWSFALNFIVSSFTNVFVSMRKIGIFSIWQSIYFVSILSLLFFKQLPFFQFLKIYVIIEVFCYFILALIIFSIVSRYESSLRKL
jgi:lipopolysaccharide exporter